MIKTYAAMIEGLNRLTKTMQENQTGAQLVMTILSTITRCIIFAASGAVIITTCMTVLKMAGKW